MARRPTSTLRFFAYSHLPEHLQAISKPFHDLAIDLEGKLPDGPEKTVAIRKLLEAKDAAVRTAVKPISIRLLKHVGDHPQGKELEVNHIIPHGGHTDDALQYVTVDGTYVLERYAEVIK